MRLSLRLAICASFLAISLPIRSDSADVLGRANRSTVEIKASHATGTGTLRSSGAGVILSADGYIVTALHVVRGFDAIDVRLIDGAARSARVVQRIDDLDLALLKVPASNGLVPAVLAQSSRIQPGRAALVVGNPGGAGQSAVRGKLGQIRMVTWDGNRAPLRSIEADVHPGNSGGGAFDIETGELLGVTVAKSSTMAYTGYVVPSHEIAEVIRDLPAVARDVERGAPRPLIAISSRSTLPGLAISRVEPSLPASDPSRSR